MQLTTKFTINSKDTHLNSFELQAAYVFVISTLITTNRCLPKGTAVMQSLKEMSCTANRPKAKLMRDCNEKLFQPTAPKQLSQKLCRKGTCQCQTYCLRRKPPYPMVQPILSPTRITVTYGYRLPSAAQCNFLFHLDFGYFSFLRLPFVSKYLDGLHLSVSKPGGLHQYRQRNCHL